MRRFLFVLLPLWATACTESNAPDRPAAPSAAPPGAAPLIAADAGLELVDSLVRDPRRDALPDDSLLAAEIRYGYELVRNTAGFIRHAMPLTAPGSLSDEDAQHVAAYINAKDRPVYAGKAEDYPGGAPVDAVYYPRYPEHPLRR